MSKASFLFAFAIFTLPLVSARAGTPAGSLGGVKGRYSDWIDGLLRSGTYEKLMRSPSSAASDAADPVDVTCLETPGQKYYIGAVQNMNVLAPLARVQAIVEDFSSYAKLFPGYDAIRVESRQGNRLVTYWENHIPVFFVPNVRYRMIYDLETAAPDVKIYRYQLEKPGSLRESDGFIVLKKISASATHYLEVDFFDADWGALKTFSPGSIWPNTVDGLYESDLSFLLKAEHPGWSNDRCREESLHAVDSMKEKPGNRCAASRFTDWARAFPGIPAAPAIPVRK